MSYVPKQSQLRGTSYEVASCFGMPHVRAYYAKRDVKSNRLEEFAGCAVCHEQATNSHHEPPLGMGGRNREFAFWLPSGPLALRPALIALCGSGTTGCHGERHSGALRFRWAWDRDYFAEQWWTGYLLTHGLSPHDPELYTMGRWVISRNGKVIDEIRC